MGIIQPHNVLKTWQGQPFYLAKRTSGQPLGTDAVPVVWACQRRIDVTCQIGHANIAPKLQASNARCSRQALWFCKSAVLEDALRLWSTSHVPCRPGVALSSLQRGAWVTVPALCWPLFQALQPPDCWKEMCCLWHQIQGPRGLCAGGLERIGGKQVLGRPEVCYAALGHHVSHHPSPNLSILFKKKNTKTLHF